MIEFFSEIDFVSRVFEEIFVTICESLYSLTVYVFWLMDDLSCEKNIYLDTASCVILPLIKIVIILSTICSLQLKLRIDSPLEIFISLVNFSLGTKYCFQGLVNGWNL